LLVTHSNNALNQLFEKIADLDIDERHLVRLGHGEKALDTEKDFSKQGRVNHMLQMRLDLLQEVEKLASSLDHPTDVGYSCETAHNYFVYNILAKWEKFLAQAYALCILVFCYLRCADRTFSLEEKSTSGVKTTFPFTKFFADASQPLFLGESFDADLSRAESSFKYIRGIFERLDECRAFELLKSSYDRGNYVVTKQARLIAMTCTHAALTRSQLVQLGFKFDNILMEEAAQILEIETFIPMLLQEQDPEAGARLKRVVMIGDHNQLPPIVQNMAFQKFGHLDQVCQS
jgi:intron-binding protein aquarius